jgi:hypothetical protein
MPVDTRTHENLKARGGEIKMVLLASDFDQSRFLKADDIKGERKFRIKEVTVETVGDGVDKKQKLIAWFTNDKRGLVVNKTNNRVIRGAFGDDVAGWQNKIIVIFTMMVSMRGQLVPGLRVRIPPPKQAQPGPTIMSRGKERRSRLVAIATINLPLNLLLGLSFRLLSLSFKLPPSLSLLSRRYWTKKTRNYHHRHSMILNSMMISRMMKFPSR